MVDDRLDMPTDLPVPLQPPRRKRTQLLWSAAQLICGVIIGVGATLYIAKDRITWKQPQPPADAIPKILSEMQQRYSLTDEQFKRVSELVKSSMATRWTMGKEFFEAMKNEDERVRQQMQAVLTPEQYDAYLEDMKQMDQRHRSRRPPFERGPGRGPGGAGSPGRGPRRPDGEGPGPRGETEGPRPRGETDGSRPHWPGPDRSTPQTQQPSPTDPNTQN